MDSRGSDIRPTPVSPRGPGQAWMCYVACIRTREGWIYRAVVLDLCSREVLGWATATERSKALAVSALSMAIRLRRPAPGSVVYAAQSSGLSGRRVHRMLNTNGLVVCKGSSRMNWPK